MKVLISVKNNESIEHPRGADLQTLVTGFITHLQGLQGQVDCVYGTGWDSGFVIADVPTLEDAWRLVMGNPMYPYWKVEMTVLTDLVAVNQAYLAQVLQLLQ